MRVAGLVVLIIWIIGINLFGCAGTTVILQKKYTAPPHTYYTVPVYSPVYKPMEFTQ